jgi:hypothetical protein
MMSSTSSRISDAIAPLRQTLLEHPLYQELQSLEQLRVFMEHHVFAVWDFMSLLKGLQRGLTCVEVPWLPTGSPRVRRLINEIVLGEESDTTEAGEATSHFELYLEAMKEAGADTLPVERFIEKLKAGLPMDQALEQATLPKSVGEFVRGTFVLLAHGRMHEIAAAFTYGREDLLPDLFGELVARLDRDFPGRLEIYRYYLNRHIELDGDEHGALGREMVELLCGDDACRQAEAEAAANAALTARAKLWDGILEQTMLLRPAEAEVSQSPIHDHG